MNGSGNFRKEVSSILRNTGTEEMLHCHHEELYTNSTTEWTSETWSVTCHTAAGARQSPINIITHNCHFDSTLTPFKVHVSHHVHQILIRKKHNFQVSFKTDKPTSLEGGPLKNKYNLMQLHFHWGCDDEWGSEHHINGHSYAGELHLVFVSEKYTTMDQALNDPEGLCVIGIFLEPSKDECSAMAPMIASMKSSKPGCETSVKGEIDINGLIPNNSRYFTYGGSLTTPPCIECVRWIVCAEPLRLSKDQVIFQKLLIVKPQNISSEQITIRRD
nr:carbonic anhydrase 2 [Hymenolepis microstoma]